ncbi:MAG: hypothetical protein IID41_07810 [Planctomycetes bacterium]|nr:hypothetical protein [Planctomycetota bacterium]
MPDNPVNQTIVAVIEQQFDKHALAVGRVAIAWSGLHETMGELFASIATPDNEGVGWDIWHSSKADRAQRAMLEAVAKTALGKDHPVCKEILWALGKTNPLEDCRNDAIHAPYAMIFEDGSLKIIPKDFTGNVRARKLKDRDLDKELRSYEKRIHALTLFIRDLRLYDWRRKSPPPLPPRPSLRQHAQDLTRTTKRRRTPDK